MCIKMGQMESVNQREILQDHLCSFYKMLSENKLSPYATWEKVQDIFRFHSGMPHPFNNAIIGNYDSIKNKDACIKDQLDYFNQSATPFVWYVDENASQEIKDKLIQHGFMNAGVIRGVIGVLDKPIPIPQAPQDCVLELVKSEEAMEKFNELVCTIFNIQGISKELYKKALWNAAQGQKPRMFHWIAMKESRVVAVVSTFIENNRVSFWNGATLPNFRRQGLSTALRHLALKDAMAKGCSIGMSYLMSEGLAFGICSKLGYQTQWRFDAFLSPNQATK